MSSPRRVADALFRRDMLGPSFGNIAASLTGLLLVEKLCMEVVLPPFVPAIEVAMHSMGLLPFCLAGGTAIFATAFWGFGTLMALPAFLGASRWKIQPGKGLDMRALLRSMPLITLNFCIGALLAPFVWYAFLPERSFDFRSLPSTSVLIRDVAIWITVEEIMFFYLHRWMHVNKRMYAAVHKLHHTWTAPVSYIAIYSHPVEHVLCNLGPLLVGPILCRSHAAAIAIFVFLGLLHTLAVHSGYWICDDNGMHDEHHAKFTVNYGVLGVLDAWYGSYRLPQGAAGAVAVAAAKER